MPALQPPDPVKFFVSVLWREEGALREAVGRMYDRWGDVDYEGPDHPFDLTDYYEKEMGPGLQKRFRSFLRLAPPESLVEWKQAATEIEQALRGPAGRRVNIDPGYMDIHKVVLASLKYGPPKVHLGQGVYADLVCRYSRGKFHPFEWTFQDYRERRYEKELLEMRARYKAQLAAR